MISGIRDYIFLNLDILYYLRIVIHIGTYFFNETHHNFLL